MKGWLILIGFIIILALVFSFLFGEGIIGGFLRDISGYEQPPTNDCYPLSFATDENGTWEKPTTLECVQGVWVNTNVSEGFNEVTCDSYFGYVNKTYTDDGWIIDKVELQGNEFCYDDTVYLSPDTCGDYVCTSNETADNCWVDCGIVSDWGLMKVASEDPALHTYLEAEDVFVTTSPYIDDLVRRVEATNPETPFQAVKTLTREINKVMGYEFGGVAGNAQCGETPDIILSRGYGNCVDYSVVLISALRRGFDVSGVGRVRIPTRQVAGCLAGNERYATEYQITNAFQKLQGEVLGHSWSEVYVGEGRWIMSDPTMDISLTKTYFGYHKIADSDTEGLCYISNIEDRQFCEAYSE